LIPTMLIDWRSLLFWSGKPPTWRNEAGAMRQRRRTHESRLQSGVAVGPSDHRFRARN
jgi:hypothetical protein